MSVIEKLLQGAIDMHVHYGPDPTMERRVDALQAALQAQEAGMKAIVLKSHDYPTAPLAYTVSKVAQNINIFGSIALNFGVGGLNTYALETSAKLGAKVAWMPTLNSANEMEKKNLTEKGITILDGEGKLLPVMLDILDIIKSYQMVLATGHLSATETFRLVDGAVRKGISKIVITHPSSKIWGACLSLEEQCSMAEKGAFIEHCFSHTMPFTGRVDPMTMVEAIRTTGAEHCILSTDLGQAFNPAPAEGMRVLVASMLKCGLTEEEIELMIKVNPAKLLDID